MRCLPLIAAGLFLIIPGCATEPAHRTSDIDDLLDNWHAAASQGDPEGYFGVMTDDAVFIGTDANERWDLAAFTEAFREPYFARPALPGEPGPYQPAWVYVPRDRSIVFSKAGRTAWFDELLDHAKYGVARGTGVLVRDGGEWRIAQYCLTFPIPNALAPELTARIRAHDAAGGSQ